MRVMYADPPYLGCAQTHYGDHPEAHVYDTVEAHVELMERMEREADAWALSLHEPSLRVLLPLAPESVRVAAWVKPFASFKRGVDPAYTWEPVIYRTARAWNRSQLTCRDHVAANIALEKGTTGAKPAAFCFWLFELLGARPGDEFVDLFIGSGGVGEAWTAWTEDDGARHTIARASRQAVLDFAAPIHTESGNG